MMGLWGMGQLSLTKVLIVVDEDVSVHDINDVIWAVTTRSDPKRDTMLIENAPTDSLDPASPLLNLGSKMGIDATKKTKEEGFERPVQEEALPDKSTINLVTKNGMNMVCKNEKRPVVRIKLDMINMCYSDDD